LAKNSGLILLKAKISLRFFGGAGEIGGNQVLIEADDTRIFLDFGLNLSKYNEYFKKFFSEPKEVSELVKVGLIPNLKDLEAIDACFISHAHTDHWKSIVALPKNTKVYANSCTKKLIDASISSSRSKIEHYDHLDFNQFRTNDVVRIRNIEVEIFSVDHSVPGANAFLVHTSAGTLAYSGDFRLHGRYQPSTYFWEPVKERGEKIESLICEATNSGRLLSVQSEKDVEMHCTNCIEKCKRLVIVDISANDTERVRTLLNVAEKTNRKMLATRRIIESLKAVQDEPDIYLPKVEEVSLFEEMSHHVKNNPNKYIVCTSFYGEKEVRELMPPPSSLYILSSSEPFEEEREIDFRRLQNWLNIYGVPMYQIHSSGHSFPLDLRYVVQKLKPKTVFPVHTIYPDVLRKLIEDLVAVTIPVKSQRYAIGN
jgi:ribonuclease J